MPSILPATQNVPLHLHDYLAVLPGLASVPRATLVAGERLGSIHLGMSCREVRKHYGKPTGTMFLRQNAYSYQVNDWAMGNSAPRLTVLTRHGKVIQIEANGVSYHSQDGLTNSSLFGTIRRRHARMRTRLRLLHEEVGGVYYVDDTQHGVAWAIYTNHLDAFPAGLRLKLMPDKVIVHRRGCSVLLDASGTWRNSSRNLSDQAWFNAEPRQHRER